MSLNSGSVYEFGPFRLDTAERTLWRGGEPVALTPKAIDTLLVLVQNRGRLVEKQELLRSVWADTFVEDVNLHVQISLLRKTLGDGDYIATIPRRGYRFTAPVSEAGFIAPAVEPGPEPAGGIDGARKRKVMLAAAVVLMAVALAGAWRVWRGSPSLPPLRSLAVLPFQILRPEPGDEQLGLGFADAVITRLGVLNRFVVRPTSAVRQFDNPQRDPVTAGRILSVDGVLDARMEAAGDRIRVNAQLIRVSDGGLVWTESLDLKRADLFALQDEIAASLGQAMFGAAPVIQRRRPAPEAHRLYTIGLHHRYRWTSESQRKAIEYFQQAVALDPNYAAAHAGLANSYAVLGYFFGMPPREAYPKAEAAAKEALRLDGHSSEAHHVLGVIRLFYDWKWDEAERHLRRSLELNPNNADSHQVYGVLKASRGRSAEGIASLKRTVEINPTSQFCRVGLAFQYTCARRFPEAIAELKQALELDPGYAIAMNDLFNLSMLTGNAQEGVEWSLNQMAAAGLKPEEIAVFREAYRQSGIHGFLRARIRRIEERIRHGGPGNPVALAMLNIWDGDREAALGWLEEAYQQRASLIIYIKQQPIYDALRGEPRFQELVRRIGI